MNKKVYIVIGAIAVLAIVVMALIVMLQKDPVVTTEPTLQGNGENLTTANPADQWRIFESAENKYGLALPPNWFLDHDSVIGGGQRLVLSNKSELNASDSGSVLVEFIPNMTKKNGESLLSAVKSAGKKNGDFGVTTTSVTTNGYEFLKVENAFGDPVDGPGYAIAKNQNSYMFVVASNDSQSEMLERIISTLVFTK